MMFKTERMFLFVWAVTIIVLASSIYAISETIITDSTTNSTVDSNLKSTTTINSPPPSAISPSLSMSNSDLCTVGVSGAVQTQILGISAGKTVRDMNCERLKNAKVLYDMGMKVAAVSLMCQSRSVYDSMKFAGTPCPINNPVTGEGLIGTEATAEWRLNPKKIPKKQQTANMDRGVFLEKLVSGILGVILLAILLV